MKCLQRSVLWLLSLICLPGSEKFQLEQIKESLSNASSSWTSPSFISLCSMVLEITLKKKKAWGCNIKYPSPADHISSNLKHRILCLCQAGSSDHWAHSHCGAGTQQIMWSFGHWVPKNTWASSTHSSAPLAGSLTGRKLAVCSVKQEYSKCKLSVQRYTCQKHWQKERMGRGVCHQ